MSRKRRQDSSKFKARAALTALKGEQTMSEIAAHFEIHPIMVSQWKRDLLDNATGVFEGMSPSKTAQKTQPEPPLPSKQGMARIAIRLPQHFDSARGSVIMLEGQRLSLDCCAGIKCQRGEGAR